jgi:hypothetical protein
MRIVFVLIFFMIVLNATSQVSSSKCFILDNTFNTSEVKSTFHLKYENDTLMFIEKGKWFDKHCNSFMWGSNYVRIVRDSVVINKILTKEPYLIFKEDCKTFIIDRFKRKSNLYYLSILQPCSGLLTEAVIKYNKKRVKIISVKKYVL